MLSDTLIAELVLDKSKVAQSVARHPYEAGMPDLGDVRERRMRKLGKEEAMCSISITARVFEERSVGLLGTRIKMTIMTDYDYYYCDASRGRKVSVHRTIRKGDNSYPQPVFYIDQPTTYQDP